MRLAIIDLGTNSVRFDVHKTVKSGLKLLHREKRMVRLGERVFLQGHLSPHAIRRTLIALRAFKTKADELKVDHLVAFGTSALREASDASRFVKLVKQKVGISLEIISGRDEARLIAEGILSHRKKTRGSFALVDIGGGSVEISHCRRGRGGTVGKLSPRRS